MYITFWTHYTRCELYQNADYCQLWTRTVPSFRFRHQQAKSNHAQSWASGKTFSLSVACARMRGRRTRTLRACVEAQQSAITYICDYLHMFRVFTFDNHEFAFLTMQNKLQLSEFFLYKHIILFFIEFLCFSTIIKISCICIRHGYYKKLTFSAIYIYVYKIKIEINLNTT